MAIAVFMILNQLKIATDIVIITSGALMGAVALGMALAFGLGGRDVASRRRVIDLEGKNLEPCVDQLLPSHFRRIAAVEEISAVHGRNELVLAAAE